MEACLLVPHDPRWAKSLAQVRHDFYHLPKYVALCAEQEGGQPYAFLAAEGRMGLLLPLIVRPIPSATLAGSTLHDAASPYGYPSPLVWNFESPPGSGTAAAQADHGGDEPLERFLHQALERLQATLLARNIVSLFVRFHPLLPVPLGPFGRDGTIVHHGETVYLDLTLSDEEQWQQMRPAFRNRIQRARRNDVVAHIDDPWDSFDDFFEIYTDTMRRVGASQFYFFPKQYFLELKDALDGALHLAVVHLEHDVACAGLFSEVDGIVQLHLTGNRPEYAEHHASKFLIDSVRRWAKERGNQLFHLGGGVGAQSDSLMHFKAGFSKLRGHFHTWRVVVHKEAYQELARPWQQQVALSAPGSGDFFPIYRQPLPPRVSMASVRQNNTI